MTWEQIAASGLQNCFPSLARIILGVSIASLLGLALGYARYALPPILQKSVLLNFIIEAPRYPPPIAWIPFVILLAGIGELSALIIVIIGAFFPIFTGAYDGMRNIPRALIWTARSLELTRWRFFRDVLLRAALPQIFSGLRVGLGMGWMSVIAAEMVSGESGLGYSIQLERMNMQYGAMVFDIVLIGLVGFALSLSMNALESRLLKWSDTVRT